MLRSWRERVCLRHHADRNSFRTFQRVNLPTPAIVPERGAQRIPRWILLLFCAAYVLPGLVGRGPWRNADLSAFGFMASVAQGHAPWHVPAIAGIPADGGLLPYWLGALAIKLLPFLNADLAARLPFGMALAGVLTLVWYCAFHLARTEAAQPVAFAFGGEAQATDYARALADGALLALMACLGLLQLGHETTPEIIQLLAIALFAYGMAAAPFRPRKSLLASLLALPILATSGAPAVAIGLGLAGALVCQGSHYDSVRRQLPWILLASALAALAAWPMEGWAWRMNAHWAWELLPRYLSMLGWFCWPAWPLAAWTLWRWRRHSMRRHISVPLSIMLVPLLTSLLMNASDRAMMLALPAMAVLAAFALPTLRRGVSAAIDWFSVFFFSAVVLFIWLYYVSMQTGWPATPLANIRRLADGFQPHWSPLALGLALLGSAAWFALVRWRTARHQHALWKSLVLPAGGVALGWLLLMTLGLPAIDYARSNLPLVQRLSAYLPREANCISAPGLPLHVLAAMEFQGGWTVDAQTPLAESRCSYAVIAVEAAGRVGQGWHTLARVKRPTERQASLVVLKHQTD